MRGTHINCHRNLDVSVVSKLGLKMSFEERIRRKVAKRIQKSISGWGPGKRKGTAKQSAVTLVIMHTPF